MVALSSKARPYLDPTRSSAVQKLTAYKAPRARIQNFEEERARERVLRIRMPSGHQTKTPAAPVPIMAKGKIMYSVTSQAIEKTFSAGTLALVPQVNIVLRYINERATSDA
jgi:hypothetical protein